MKTLEGILSRHNQRQLNIIELGSGCGIVGITLASSYTSCHVVLTDLHEASSICERNIRIANVATSSSLQFEVLDWDLPLPPLVSSKIFDLVLVADCTYNPDSSPSLVKSLSKLLQNSPEMLVVVAMKVRHPSEAVFFEYMNAAHFTEKERLDLPVATENSAEEETIQFHVFSGHRI
jgi:predicted nicotinamide N-methyase